MCVCRCVYLACISVYLFFFSLGVGFHAALFVCYIYIYVCILTELINNVLLLFPGYHCGIFLIVKSRDFSFCSDFEVGLSFFGCFSAIPCEKHMTRVST